MILIISAIFILGYAAITLEHTIKINKAATALLTGVLCWSVFALVNADFHHVSESLAEHLGDVASILFFLMGAMTIVEIVDAHDGFEIIKERIRTKNKKKLIWLIALIAFFLSSILDNLTTTIVMISLLRKMVPDRNERLLFIGLIIIAANAGGAWSPIGDVTTTMLWIGNQVTTLNIMIKTFAASLTCVAVPAFILSLKLKGSVTSDTIEQTKNNLTTSKRERSTVFWFGVGALMFVPVFKAITHLPPYMGILFGLGVMWVITEIIHSGKSEEEKGMLSVSYALKQIDISSVLFFLGILMSVAALQSTGILADLSQRLNDSIGNIKIITISIGFISSVIDNVPLVAAAQGMYGLDQYPTDHYFWEFLAYCAGTGGSCLIIGSAAGVAAMGMEKIDFFWYLKKISWLAVIGYLTGAGIFILQQILFHL